MLKTFIIFFSLISAGFPGVFTGMNFMKAGDKNLYSVFIGIRTTQSAHEVTGFNAAASKNFNLTFSTPVFLRSEMGFLSEGSSGDNFYMDAPKRILSISNISFGGFTPVLWSEHGRVYLSFGVLFNRTEIVANINSSGNSLPKIGDTVHSGTVRALFILNKLKISMNEIEWIISMKYSNALLSKYMMRVDAFFGVAIPVNDLQYILSVALEEDDTISLTPVPSDFTFIAKQQFLRHVKNMVGAKLSFIYSRYFTFCLFLELNNAAIKSRSDASGDLVVTQNNIQEELTISDKSKAMLYGALYDNILISRILVGVEVTVAGI